MKKYINFLKWPSIITGTLAILLILIFCFFQTDAGRERLLLILNRSLAENSIRIVVKNSGGVLPFSFTADHLEVFDKEGVFLGLENITFRLSAGSLFKGHLHIKELSADSAVFNALPKVNKKEMSDEKDEGFIPEILFRLGISRFIIKHLKISESLFGESMDFRIMLSLSGDSELNQSLANVYIDRLDKPGSSMFFNAMVRGTEPWLTMTAGIEDQNGFITGLMGSKGKTLLDIKGEGPLTDWSGSLSADVENIASLESDIGLELGVDTRLKLAGDIDFKKDFLPENINKIIGNKTGFAVEASLTKKRILEFDRLELDTKAADFSFNGSMGLKNLSAKGSFNILIDDLAFAEEYFNGKAVGTARLNGDFKGTLVEPRVNSDISIKNLKIDAFQTEDLTANLNLTTKKNSTSTLPLFNIIFNGAFNNPSIKNDSVDFSEEKITLSFDVSGPLQTSIDVKKIGISSKNAELSASGTFNRSLKTVNARSLIEIKSIEEYKSLSGLNIKGSNILNLNIFADFLNRTLKSNFKGNLDIITEPNNSYDRYIGQKVKYSAELESKDFKSILLSNIDILSEAGSLKGFGNYDFPSRYIKSSLSLNIPDLNKLPSAIENNLKGMGQLHADIKGPIDRIEVNTKTSIQNLSVNNRKIGNLTAAIIASGKPMDNEGNISITLNKSGNNIKGVSFFKLNNNILNLSKLKIEGSGIRMEGDLNTRIDRPLLDGSLNLICEDLTGPSSFFGENISGSLSIDGAIHSGKTDIDINMNIIGSDIVSRFIAAEQVNIKSKITGSIDSPLIDSHVSLKNIKQENLVLDSVDARVTGNVNNAGFNIIGTGRSAHKFRVDLGGIFLRDEAKQVLSINRLQAEYEAMPLNLIKPFNLTKSTDNIELENIELNFNRGKIKSSGSLVNNQINFSLEYSDLPLSSLSLFGISNMKGYSSGNLIIGGSLSEPVITNKMDVDFQWVLSDKDDEPSQIKAALNTIFDSGNLHANVSVNGIDSGTFTGSIDVPVELTLMPFSYSMIKTGQINGNLSGMTEMQNIAPFIEFSDHRINGGLDMNLSFGGTVEAPVLSGRVDIKNGGYENLKTGTILRELEMSLSAEPSEIKITKIKAVDGFGGEISGKGRIKTTPETRFPYKLELDLKGFTLAQNNMISITADGQPVLSGSMDGHNLNGSIEINRAEVNIPDKLPPEITELDVIEINVEESYKDFIPVRTKKKESSPIKLELSVISPGRIFINGRGLTSEWNGDLDIKGSADSPVLTGKLSIVRGYYNLLGKRLQLTAGNIYFDGKVPVSPRIDITGETVSEDIKVIIKIAGDVTNPEFKLESEPYLPSDEIFSRLLFGRSVSQITPVQAIKLASAVNTFIKGGKSFNILDRTRKFLMVDQLEIRQAEGNVRDSTISAGKYLRDNIYLEVEQGIGSESSSASVKWELTPNISLEAEVNSKEETESGINWKKDY